MSGKKFSTRWLEHWLELDNAPSFRTTLDNIAEHGWSAMLIEGDPHSRFAYSVGAYDTMRVPELIVVGLPDKTAHASLGYAIELLRSRNDVTQGRQRGIVGEVEVEFRPVDSKWIGHVMCRTHWYYNGADIPALQIIYPDLQGRFQWEPQFEEYFHQPLLQPDVSEGDREREFWLYNDPRSSLFDWKFPDPPHTRTYVSKAIESKEEPITYVAHDHDGDWQFLGDTMAESGGVIACLYHHVENDPSIRELHDLPKGWYADRENSAAPWTRYELTPDEDEES